MAYEKPATAQTPALIIYLIDVSASMQAEMDGKPRIQVVGEALESIISHMASRCMRGMTLIPRYRLAMLAYSDRVYDMLGGVKTIEELMMEGLPQLDTLRTTDACRAFLQAEKILRREWESLRNGPVPLVCHLTDGEYTGDDPQPVAERIKRMALPDGNVLVENIFISDEVLEDPIDDPKRWEGVFPSTRLASEYAGKLRDMSSALPEQYRRRLATHGFSLGPGALMMLPGNTPDLLALGYQMSAATEM